MFSYVHKLRLIDQADQWSIWTTSIKDNGYALHCIYPAPVFVKDF